MDQTPDLADLEAAFADPTEGQHRMQVCITSSPAKLMGVGTCMYKPRQGLGGGEGCAGTKARARGHRHKDSRVWRRVRACTQAQSWS